MLGKLLWVRMIRSKYFRSSIEQKGLEVKTTWQYAIQQSIHEIISRTSLRGRLIGMTKC